MEAFFTVAILLIYLNTVSFVAGQSTPRPSTAPTSTNQQFKGKPITLRDYFLFLRVEKHRILNLEFVTTVNLVFVINILR